PVHPGPGRAQLEGRAGLPRGDHRGPPFPVRRCIASPAMITTFASPVTDGIAAVMAPDTLLVIGIGILIGMLVGAFPGVTATMAVALASGFTLTMEPTQGLAMLLTIYVAAQFGDRIPAILINTPGTPAS